VPAAQLVQAMKPALLWNFPALQLLQLDLPMSPWKVPGAHCLHTAAFAAEKVPAAQSWHDSPVLNVPALHSLFEHVLCPASE
jgi:hypothetical protein